jgi:aspartyl-tRNA(Asn)/glutamyl-tRNA(Gln) amidotransferase subunit C
MARVTPETVARIALLARLSLTDEERRLYARQLADVLEYAESLAALDTPPGPDGATPAGSAFREDEPRAGLDPERALEAAPDAAEGLFRVPRVLPG